MSKTVDNFIKQIYTYDELGRRGVTRNAIQRYVKQGKLIRLGKGLYSKPQLTQDLARWEEEHLKIAVHFKSAPNSIFSHRSAALLHGLSVLGLRQNKVHTYCAYESRGSGRGVVKHPREIRQEDIELSNNGITRTNLVVTLIDCAISMNYEAAMVTVESALFKQVVTYEQLRIAMLQYRGRSEKKVHRIAQTMSALSESPGETLTHIRLDELGIRYVQQHWTHLEGNAYRADFYLPDFNVYVEFDGVIKYREFQATDQVLIAERQREKAFWNSGARVFRAEWSCVFHDPQQFKVQLRRFLGSI